MIKLLGAFLLMLGAASLGLGAISQLKARVTGLRALTAGLGQMERELSFRLTPMPELLERLARTAPAPADLFFAHCRDGLDRLCEQSMGEIWREALEEETDLLLSDEERQLVCSLGAVLGRYDGDGQRQALRTAMEGLEDYVRRAEMERDRMSRVYGALGLGAGAMMVILLI